MIRHTCSSTMIAEIRAYVDIKFAQLVNDTKAYQDAIDSMDRYMSKYYSESFVPSFTNVDPNATDTIASVRSAITSLNGEFDLVSRFVVMLLFPVSTYVISLAACDEVDTNVIIHPIHTRL